MPGVSLLCTSRIRVAPFDFDTFRASMACRKSMRQSVALLLMSMACTCRKRSRRPPSKSDPRRMVGTRSRYLLPSRPSIDQPCTSGSGSPWSRQRRCSTSRGRNPNKHRRRFPHPLLARTCLCGRERSPTLCFRLPPLFRVCHADKQNRSARTWLRRKGPARTACTMPDLEPR